MSDTWIVGEDLPLLEEAVYGGVLIGIEDTMSKIDPEKKQLVLKYQLTEPGYEGHEISQYVNAPEGALRPKMGMYKIAEALLGIKLADLGRGLNRQELIGKPCQLVIGINTKTDGTQYNKVTSVMKARLLPVSAPETVVHAVQAVHERVNPPATMTPAQMVVSLFDKKMAAIKALPDEEQREREESMLAAYIGTLGASDALAYSENGQLMLMEEKVTALGASTIIAMKSALS